MIATHAILATATFLFMVPILYAMIKATQNLGASVSTSLVPGTDLIANATTVWERYGIGRMMTNTLFVTAMVTLGKTILALCSAAAFVFFRFRLQGLWFALVLFTLMMPTEVLIRALYDLAGSMQMLNTYQGLILPFIASATGTLLFRQHFLRIPRELVEAAQVDGVRPFRFLVSFLVPLSWNIIGALAVIDVIYVWNMYLWPRWAVSEPDLMMVQVGLVRLLDVVDGNHWGVIMAGAVITMIPPLIIFMLLQERFVRGFAMSGTK
ncbi:carbohydrate ABC transporter permease [Actinobacteria bacterium YIM 96077]|uniref:Carbohydrate ABC transporter permease n=1 Tax=Phytoactinopolyspora halophila TaxID=1981511 RepID=A0A329QL00_9ACTN|nr:carbohydrate ABC transporter permease [Actinobacteria bacterium YIM 96077]RAW13117.1 carbohydrate ABC transporter permease [Phytoactinopolyspora halophila]